MPNLGFLQDVQIQSVIYNDGTSISPFVALDSTQDTQPPSVTHNSITWNFPPGRKVAYLKVSRDGSLTLRVKFKAYEKNFNPSPDGIGWDSFGTSEFVRLDLVFPSLDNATYWDTVTTGLAPYITDYALNFPGGSGGAGYPKKKFPAGIHYGFLAISHQDAFNNPLYQNLHPNLVGYSQTISGIETPLDRFATTANFPIAVYTEGWFRDFQIAIVGGQHGTTPVYVDLDSSTPSNPQSVTHNSTTYSFPSGRTVPTLVANENTFHQLYYKWKAYSYLNPAQDGAFRARPTSLDSAGYDDTILIDVVFPELNNSTYASRRVQALSRDIVDYPSPGTQIASMGVPGTVVNNQPTLYQGFIAVTHNLRENDPLYQNLAEPNASEDGVPPSVDYEQAAKFPINILVLPAAVSPPPPPPPSCASDWAGALAPDSYLYPQNGILTVQAPGVLTNDTIAFPNNSSCASTVTARLVTGPQHGTLNLASDGSFSYTPNSGFSGADSFTYGISLSGTAFAGGGTAIVNLTASALPPCTGFWDGSLANDAYSYTVGQILNVAAPGVLSNDTISYSGRADCVTTTTTRLVTQAQFGTVQLLGSGAFTYTPNPGFSGDDYFEYSVSVGGLDVPGASVARVNLTALPVLPVCPGLWTGTLTPDSYTYQAGSVLNVQAPGVLGNDTIAFGGNLECSAQAIVIVTSQPQHGTVSLSPDGAFTYTPNQNHTGTDTFSYGISVDGTSVPAAGTTSVTLTSFSPEAPVIQNDSYTVLADTVSLVGYPGSGVGLTLGVLANDAPGTTGDPGSDTPLTAVLLEPPGPSFASVSLNPDGSFVFTPVGGYSGSLTWTYRASNNAGSGDGVVTMTVVSPPPPPPPPVVLPVLNTDVYSVGRNRTLNVPVSSGFLANDVPGSVFPTLVASIVPGKGPINGHLNASPDGSFIYLPSTNFIGTDTFAYQVPSGDGDTYVEGKVLITVSESPPVSPPVSPPASPISTDPVTVTISNLSSPVEQTRPSVGYDLTVTPTVLNVFADDETGVYSGDVEVSLKVTPARSVLHGQSLQEIVQLKAISTDGVLFLPKNTSPAVTPDIEMVASPNIFIRPTGSYHYLTSKVTLINNSYKTQDLLLTATCEWSLAIPIFDNSSVTLQPGEIREVALTIQLVGIESLDTWDIELKAVDLNGIQKAQDFIKLSVLNTNPAVDDFYISTAETGTLTFTIGDPVSEILETVNPPSGTVRWYSTADTILAAYNLFLTDSGVLQSSGVRGPATQFLATIVCVVENKASRSYAGKAFNIIIS